MVVQAQAARLGVERGRDDAAVSIEAIEVTGREALNADAAAARRAAPRGRAASRSRRSRSLRRRSADLVEQARALGLDVHMDAERTRLANCRPASTLAAYRIAQEALLLGDRARPATRIDARLATRGRRLEMDLDADGPIALATLAGLRERAGMFGGSIEVEPRGRRRDAPRSASR